MVCLEVSGAGCFSGRLELTADLAARWQVVRHRLACDQLADLVGALLQLAEKQCRDLPDDADAGPWGYSAQADISDGPETTGHMVPAAELTQCHGASSAGCAQGHTTLAAAEPPSLGCAAGAGNRPAAAAAAEPDSLCGTEARDLPSPGHCSPDREPGARSEGENSTPENNAPGGHQISVIHEPDRIVSHEAQAPAGGLFSDHVLDGRADACWAGGASPGQAPAGRRAVRPAPLPADSTPSAGSPGWRALGAEDGVARPSSLRHARAARPCVLRRGRALCSTDGATVFGADDVTIRDLGGVSLSRGDGWPSSGAEDAGAESSEAAMTSSPTELQAVAVAEAAELQAVTVTAAAELQTVTVAAAAGTPPLGRAGKVAPQSPCAGCGLVHEPDVCPLQRPRRWLQDASGPLAADSLPPGLTIDGSTVRAGPDGLQAFTLLGPLRGASIRPEQLGDKVDLHHIWEVYGEGLFVDTSDEASSNWLRWLRPATVRGDRTVALITRHRRLFGVTTCDLAPGEELLFWQDDPGTTWQSKNMLKNSCGGCNLKFGHPLYYRRHCSLFHEPGAPLTVRKYYCKVCGQGVLGRQKLIRHAAERHAGDGAYQCQHCSKFFRRLSSLEMHRNHGCSANPERTHPLCHLCGAKFCQPQKLRVHIRRMHSDSEASLAEFQCGRCGRLLGCRTALRRHLREVHSAAEGRHQPLSCRRCGRTFQNGSNLKVHMLTHSGVKPFHCAAADCGATFTTKQCLQFHYRRAHQLTGAAVPAIRRVVPYTLSAYSGGLLEEPTSVAAAAAAATRRRLTRADAIAELTPAVRDRLRFPDFSVSRDLPDPSNGPRLLHEASRTELDSIEPSVGLILDMSSRHRTAEADRGD